MRKNQFESVLSVLKTFVPAETVGAGVVVVFGSCISEKSVCSIIDCFESVARSALFLILRGSLYPGPSYRTAPMK